MSDTVIPGATITTERATTQIAAKIPAKQKQQRPFRFVIHFSPLWVCLLIALVLRIWLTIRTHGVIDGDEAMVGIQAEHILRGERPLPLYFYGQPYMGSLEAYLTAVLFKIAGPSVWTLRAEPTLLSLVVVWLTGRLAAALADAAQLATRAKRLFISTAMLFAAVSPVYDTVLEMRTLGGYIETFILMLLLLLSAFRLTQRWHADASGKELVWRWAGIGFIIGLGLWVDPLIASAIAAAALWIAGDYIAVIVRQKRLSGTIGARYHMAVVPGFVCGASPAIYWGMRYKWANVTYLLQLGNQPQSAIFQQQYPTRLDVVRGMLWFYGKVMTPRLVGGALPGEDAVSSALHSITTITGVLCILITLALVVCSCIFRRPQWRRIRHLAMLPLLFALCAAILFCTSPIASVALLSPQHDLAGRYATPLMLVLPFFFATTITAIVLWLYKDDRETQWQIKRHVQNIESDGRPRGATLHATPPPSLLWTIRRHLPRHRRDGGGVDRRGGPSRASVLATLTMFVLLLMTLSIQAASYGMVDPAATFQSPSCPLAPANDDPIIAYLQQEHVHYAWAIPWIGNPITFKTNDGIITADPRPVINFMGLTRINAYLRDVSLANRPALLTFVQHRGTYPLLLRVLDTKHITYRAAYFPAEPGVDVLVVTRLSRTLSLYESKYLRDVFRNCI